MSQDDSSDEPKTAGALETYPQVTCASTLLDTESFLLSSFSFSFSLSSSAAGPPLRTSRRRFEADAIAGSSTADEECSRLRGETGEGPTELDATVEGESMMCCDAVRTG